MDELSFVVAIAAPTIAALLLLLALTGFPFIENHANHTRNEADHDSERRLPPLVLSTQQEARQNRVGSVREHTGNVEGTETEARRNTDGSRSSTHR